MFLKRLERRRSGKGHIYWALVESYRTAGGSRHRVVAYLGELKKSQRSGWAQFCRQLNPEQRPQPSLFDPPHYSGAARVTGRYVDAGGILASLGISRESWGEAARRIRPPPRSSAARADTGWGTHGRRALTDAGTLSGGILAKRAPRGDSRTSEGSRTCAPGRARRGPAGRAGRARARRQAAIEPHAGSPGHSAHRSKSVLRADRGLCRIAALWFGLVYSGRRSPGGPDCPIRTSSTSSMRSQGVR
jgi:hypothetical protein